MEPKVKLALPGRFTISQLLMDDVPVTLVPLPELTLRATYFDTSDLRLARHGVKLRYRTGDETGPTWTLKLATALSGAASSATSSTSGTPREPPAEARALVTAFARREPLIAVATLRTRRRRLRLLDEGQSPSWPTTRSRSSRAAGWSLVSESSSSRRPPTPSTWRPLPTSSIVPEPP